MVFQGSRGGHSVTLVGSSLVIFGGEGAKRSLLNDLHILDLETLTWDEIETVYDVLCNFKVFVCQYPRTCAFTIFCLLCIVQLNSSPY